VPGRVPSWLLLSIVLAVVLWFLATLLDDRLQAPEEMPEGVQPADEPGLDAVQPPGENGRNDDGGVELMSCQESEDRLKVVIEDARSCNVDDDCTLFDYGYPLDCLSSVAKEQIPKLREEYRRYGEACEHRVFYDCPTEPFVRLALCRNNRCVVELDRRDDLEDATLDQLNRRRVP
jgi:hypothetical protein